MEKLTQKEAQRLFNYREDGQIVWRVRIHPKSNNKPGDIAGGLKGHGYMYTMVYRKFYLNHQIVWLMHYGYFPERDIDHINRDKIDNRIENLREISAVCNQRNTNNRRNNTSGVKGVYWHKIGKKWSAQIKIVGKMIGLGLHEDFLEAVCHRLAAEQAVNWEGCDSSSPALKYVKKYLFGAE